MKKLHSKVVAVEGDGHQRIFDPEHGLEEDQGEATGGGEREDRPVAMRSDGFSERWTWRVCMCAVTEICPTSAYNRSR